MGYKGKLREYWILPTLFLRFWSQCLAGPVPRPHSWSETCRRWTLWPSLIRCSLDGVIHPYLSRSRPRIRGPTWLTRFSAAHPERRVPSLLSLGPGKELVERSTTYAVKMVVRWENQICGYNISTDDMMALALWTSGQHSSPLLSMGWF